VLRHTWVPNGKFQPAGVELFGRTDDGWARVEAIRA
jgi:hypothetical protein